MTRVPEVPVKKIAARFFVSANGNKPVREWLLEMDAADRRAIGTDIQKVEFGRPNRKNDLFDSRWRDGPDARVRKEDAEDAAKGHRCGDATDEGTGLMERA